MAGYGTDEGLTAYATANGLTLPSGNLPAARQRGSMYVDSAYEDRFPGAPTNGASQERAWPRTGATDRYGVAIASDVVPQRVEWASYEAAIAELSSPGSLAPVVVASDRVKREKVDVIETEYVVDGGAAEAATPTITAVAGLLAPLLAPSDLPAILVI